MLIWIDASVQEADLGKDHNACCGITGIFEAVYRGEHYALGDRKTLTALHKDTNLSTAVRVVIGNVLSNLATLGGIREAVRSQVTVTYRTTTPFRKAPSFALEVPLTHLGEIGIKRTVLIAENLIDVRAFEHAANQYQVDSRLPGHVALEGALGGGSTTPIVFSNLADTAQRWCLCITDSDRIYPDATLATHAQECDKIAKKSFTISTHVDLPAREAENILPIAFVSEVIPETHKRQWLWHVETLIKLRPDVRLFCDIKKGITLRKVRSYEKKSPGRTYWDGVVRDLEEAAALTTDCLSLDECTQSNQTPCQCHVAYGFGEKVLELVVEKLDGRTPHLSEKMTHRDINREEWMDIGRIVFEWCCAPKKMRI